jgi:signal transduction histidine kinase/CheY-like chemotaxis protein/streptogramin lyase
MVIFRWMFLLFACWAVLPLQARQLPSYAERRYTTKDGLAHNVCYDLVQDAQGYLLVGTDDGLASFDGRRFVSWTPSDGLPSSFVIGLANLPGGALLAATWGGGIVYLDSARTQFTPLTGQIPRQVRHLIRNGRHLIAWNHFQVADITLSDDGKSVVRSRICAPYIHPNTGRNEFSELPPNADGEKSLAQHIQWNHLLTDQQYWIDTLGRRYAFGHFPGIRRFDTDTTFDEPFASVLGNDVVSDMVMTPDGDIWLGGGSRLYRIGTDGTFSSFDPGLGEQGYWDLHVQGSQIAFLTQRDVLPARGCGIYDWKRRQMLYWRRPEEANATLSMIHLDPEGHLWISTDGEGLIQVYPQPFLSFKKEEGLRNSFVYDVAEHDGDIWLGGKDGIYRWQPPASFEQILPERREAVIRRLVHTASGQLVAPMPAKDYRLANGRWEVSTPSMYGGGRPVLAIDTLVFLSFDYLFKVAEHTDSPGKYRRWQAGEFRKEGKAHTILAMVMGPDSKVWLGTGGGIFRFDPKRDQMDTLRLPGRFAQIQVNALAPDGQGGVWIGTEEGVAYWKEGGLRQCLTVQDGLASDKCRTLLWHPASKLLFVGTPQGLSVWNGTWFETFRTEDGLASDDVNKVYADSQGRLWVAGSNGVAMSPALPQMAPARPPTISMQAVEANQRPVALRFGQSLAEPFPYQSTLRFEFSVLELHRPEGRGVQYRMNGGEWVQSPGGALEFPLLPDGDHVLEVRAKKANSPWSEPVAVRFSVAPPVWRSRPAIALYALLASLLAGMGYSYSRARRRRIIEAHKHALYVDSTRKQAAMQANFFANISHELRTPLTLVMGMVDYALREHPSPQARKHLDIAKRNADALMLLINQLLSLSKIDAQKEQLQRVPRNLMDDLRLWLESFEALAEKEGIEMRHRLHAAPVWVPYDPEKMRQIVANLLSNAIKYTHEGGSIEVATALVDAERGKFVQLSVKDTGIGIAPADLPYVFDRFYRASLESPTKAASTGIGLALVKELVALHQGQVWVRSEEGRGSLFTVELPCAPAPEVEAPLHTAGPHNERYLVLVADDNPDMRQYLSEILSPNFEVLLASQGEEALALALEQVPDLVVSDWMMPGGDGLGLCRALKADARTSHVPVVLLTAKSGIDSRLEGLGAGADDYLGKPFYPEELLLRIGNLLERSEKIRRQLAQSLLEPRPDPQAAMAIPTDPFLDQAREAVVQHLSNPDFDIQELMECLHMSRSTLHRKIKAVSGQSATEFIRTIRLSEAAQRLRDPEATVTGVCFDVGFHNLHYFSRSFSKAYGMPPSAYAAQFRPAS